MVQLLHVVLHAALVCMDRMVMALCLHFAHVQGRHLGRKQKKRLRFSRRQVNEKPSIIPGCPGTIWTGMFLHSMTLDATACRCL